MKMNGRHDVNHSGLKVDEEVNKNLLNYLFNPINQTPELVQQIRSSSYVENLIWIYITLVSMNILFNFESVYYFRLT